MIIDALLKCFNADDDKRNYYHIVGLSGDGQVYDFGLYEDLAHARYVSKELEKVRAIGSSMYFKIEKLEVAKNTYFEQLGIHKVD